MLLAAILFPVFQSARDKGREAACLSNMKQIGAAMMLYCDDNDGYFPMSDYCAGQTDVPVPVPVGSTESFGTQNPAVPLPGAPRSATGCWGSTTGDLVSYYKWWYWLYPYTKSTDVFFCPSRPLEASDTSAYNDWVSNGEIQNGYALNMSMIGEAYTIKGGDEAGICGFPYSCRNSFMTGLTQSDINYGNGAALKPVAQSNLVAPDQLLMVTEKAGYVLPTYDYPDSTDNVSFPPADRGYWLMVFKDAPTNAYGAINNDVDPNAAPHQKGVVICYADGHTKWLSVEQFLANCIPTEDNYANAGNFGSPCTPTAADCYPANWPSLSKTGRDWPMWGLYRSEFP